MTRKWLEGVQEKLTECQTSVEVANTLADEFEKARKLWRRSKSGHEYYSRAKWCMDALTEWLLGHPEVDRQSYRSRFADDAVGSEDDLPF